MNNHVAHNPPWSRSCWCRRRTGDGHFENFYWNLPFQRFRTEISAEPVTRLRCFNNLLLKAGIKLLKTIYFDKHLHFFDHLNMMIRRILHNKELHYYCCCSCWIIMRKIRRHWKRKKSQKEKKTKLIRELDWEPLNSIKYKVLLTIKIASIPFFLILNHLTSNSITLLPLTLKLPLKKLPHSRSIFL